MEDLETRVSTEVVAPGADVHELDIVAGGAQFNEVGREQYLNEPAVDEAGNKIFHCATD